MHSLTTRHRAEAWLSANPTPAPAALTAFVARKPRVLPQPRRATRYARLSWLAAAFVAWVLVGTLVAKLGPIPQPVALVTNAK